MKKSQQTLAQRKASAKATKASRQHMFQRISSLKLSILQYTKSIPEYEKTLAYLKATLPKLEKELHGVTLAYDRQTEVLGKKTDDLTKAAKREKILKQIRDLETQLED